MPMIVEAAELKKLKADMDVLFADYHGTAIPTDERYYNLDISHLLNLPRKFRRDAVVLPTGRDAIEAAVDHVTPQFRRVLVPRRTVDDKGTQQAQAIQAFYEALLTYLERQGIVSPYREMVKHLALYGLSIPRLDYNPSVWPIEPKRAQFEEEADFNAARDEWRHAKSERMPFSLQLVNPREVVFDMWHDPPQWVLQVSKRFVGDVVAAFPNWPNIRSRRMSDQVDVFEFYDNKVRSLLIDDAPALKSKDGSGVLRHKLGTHPYIIGSSGFGIDDSEHKPEKRFVGLLRYVTGVLLSESRNYSIADIVMKAGAWPVRTAEGERANEMPSIKLEYGQIHPLPPGVVIKDLTPQLPPAMVFSFMQMASSIISSSVSPRVVRGLGQPGLTSGFDRQLALGEARLRYGPLAAAVEALLTGICQKAGLYMENVVPGSVSVAAAAKQDEFVEVSGRTFRGHHAVSVQVNVLEPEDEVRKHQDLASMVSSGLMSPQTAIRKGFPDVDPDTEMGRIIASRLLFSPQIMEILATAAVEKVTTKLGIEETVRRILTAAETPAQRTRSSPAPEEAAPEGTGAGSRSDQAALREVALREMGR